jgi:phosphoglycolate phosphatase-like HAD superfamily hydrolase
MKLVLFDVDGTLMQGGLGHVKQLSNAFKKACGREINLNDFNIQGKTDRAIATEILQHLGFGKKEIAQFAPKIIELETRFFVEDVKKEVRAALPGVKELLQQLSKADCRLGLVTGNPKGIAFAKLGKAGIAGFFSVGGFGESVMQRHELIEAAVAETRQKFNERYSGRDVVVFGDTKRDVEGAKHVGAKSIAVLTGGGSKQELAEVHPDYLFKDLTNIEDVLRAIFSDKKGRDD